jgi:hypothetical protein
VIKKKTDVWVHKLGYFYSSKGIGLFFSRFWWGFILASTRISLFQSRFFRLDEALYRSTGDSLRSMPAYVI